MTVLDFREVTELLRPFAGRADELAAALLRAAAANEGVLYDSRWNQVFHDLRALRPDGRTALADALVARYHAADEGTVVRAQVPPLLGEFAPELFRDRLPEEHREALAGLGRETTVGYRDRDRLLAGAELEAGRPLAPEIVAAFRRSALSPYWGKPLVEFAAALTEPVLNVGEVWAEQAVRDTRDDPDMQALLRHTVTATAAKPSRPWEKRAESLILPLGADRVRTAVLPWLALAGRRTFALDGQLAGPDGQSAYDPYNANALRGLAWVLALLPAHPDSAHPDSARADTARALGALVETSLRKIPGLGPRNPKVANAAVGALSRIDGEAALAELARLGTRVTYKGTLKLVDAALQARAEALGLSREEIEELAVPAYGLTEVGRAELLLGEVTAGLEVRGTRVALGWRNAAGKEVKSVPAVVKRDHAEELKELKTAVKDIDGMLSAQSERLDRQFLANRTWPYATWRERYLDHPLVGTLARRLLWTVDGTTAGFADGELRTLADDLVQPVREGSEVRLWHPVDHEPAEIVAWRDWLERHAITQPFKQAHREVYLLTDAERATGTYSNRFAAHVLRQHQFNSLASARGWRNKLRLMVDDSAPPATRALPQWGLRAEYWIHGEGEEYGDDTTESGSYLRLTTDQIRFYPIDAPQNEADCYGSEYRMWPRDGAEPVEPVPIAEVPPLVLSEVLRDVDLFVGVASVGNDPTWYDGGPEGRYRAYWDSYGFGELGQGAETRRALLERLVPRLAIADRCTLEGRFLHVKGERHTYKIHLGSGNILMTPNDQYLCIVPKPAAATPQTGYLPFEGDRMLAVILSKAMLLAEDTRITDPTILSQL
ncbi:DUF4132 domain-containing protein [Streptomyces sp. NRRL WC-3742]|uniref:DUF4132 domain-containing protein n=1 Tax=Streptomyces sp. NRRL WC-3742 TaxID=1463934 RepID=UPI0004CBCE6D|nr:DUF4132 domain-containing protein [Streptomyces sp. NRRL WC-3742]